ncbi:DUF6545 domain-containing protein [Streptomyces roseus]|uniref:DUF6545 domain-containing protein n=1 Tax=Streptomyces roseus TaxID=66430 RepID=UPI003815ACF5
MTSFALAFASYAPAVEHAVESGIPHVARLPSNTFTLTAATSVLAFLSQLNLEEARARRQIRLRVIVLVSIGLGLGLVPDHARCSTSLTPVRCTVSVTAPAVAVLLITMGLALPALLWPISQLRRHRWERNSFVALEPLREDVTSAGPEVVLNPAKTEAADTHDLDFPLHRRVIEINDCVPEPAPVPFRTGAGRRGREGSRARKHRHPGGRRGSRRAAVASERAPGVVARDPAAFAEPQRLDTRG